MSEQPLLNDLITTTKKTEVIENSFISLKITDDINESNQVGQMKETYESNQQNERNDIMNITNDKFIDAITSLTPPTVKPRRQITKTDDIIELQSNTKTKKSNIPKIQSKGAPFLQSPDIFTGQTKITTANTNKSRNKPNELNATTSKQIPSKLGSFRPYNYKQSAGGEIQVFDDKKSYYNKHKNLKRHSGGEIEIFNVKATYDVSSKIDSFNTNYKKSSNNVEIKEKSDFLFSPNLDAHNSDKLLTGDSEKNPFLSENLNYKTNQSINSPIDDNVSNELDEVSDLSLQNKKSLIKINDLKTKINQLKQQDIQKTQNINSKKSIIEDKDNINTKQSAGNRMTFNKASVGYQQNSNQSKKNKFDIFSVPNSDVSDLELKELNKLNNNQNNWREKGKAISKRAQSNTDFEKRAALKSVKKGEKAVSVYNKRNAKLFDDLGFVEPNIKNVKSKINSTWIVQENIVSSNNQQQYNNNTRKARKNYIDSLKDRDEALSPKTKVKNWLVSSKPSSPMSNTDEMIERAQKLNILQHSLPQQQTVSINQSKFPTIKKANYDLNPDLPTNTFKKDPWLVDIPPEFIQNKQTRYESKLPNINPKVIYELVNTLTNRKPVKVNQNSYLYGFDEEEMNNIQEKAYSRNTYYSKNLESNEQYNHAPYDSKINNNNNNNKSRKFVVQISQSNSKSKRTLPSEKENLNERKKEVDLTDRLNPKIDENEALRTELDLNNNNSESTTSQQNDQMIYHTVPLVLKIGQIPLSAVDNQQYYMMKPKQSVVGNNLVQYHVSHTGRVDANAPPIQLKPIVNYTQVPQAQPMYYYQNTLPNILQNTIPNMNPPYSAGYVTVQPVQAVQPIQTIQAIPNLNAVQPSYGYVAAYPYPVQQVTQAPTVPAQYLYYNNQQQQHQPLQQFNLLSQKQLSASQDLFSSRQSQIPRATSVANINNIPNNNVPVKIPKLVINHQERLESQYVEDNNTNRISSKPKLVEPLSLKKDNKQYDQSATNSILAKRQKHDNKQTSDKYKDLIYKPRYIASKTREKQPKNDLILEEKEEEYQNEQDDRESVKSSLPSITSQPKPSITTPLLSSRPVLLDNLKLPKPRIEKEKTLTIDDINAVPKLMDNLKLPKQKPERKLPTPKPPTPKIKTPTPEPPKEEIVYIPPPKIQKEYHGKFVYPPEVEQQVEEDKDETENIFNQITESNDEITEQEVEFFYDRTKSHFMDRPKSVQIVPTIVRELSGLIEHITINAQEVIIDEINEPKDRVEVNVNQVHEVYADEEDLLKDLEVKREPSEIKSINQDEKTILDTPNQTENSENNHLNKNDSLSYLNKSNSFEITSGSDIAENINTETSKMIDVDDSDSKLNEINNVAQTNPVDLLQHVPKELFASQKEEYIEYEEAKEAPELKRIKSSVISERINSGKLEHLIVSERVNFNSVQIMENIEVEQPTENKLIRPSSSRLTEYTEENNANLKANKNNPPLVNVADEEEPEETEELEEEEEEHQDVNIDLHEANVKLIPPKKKINYVFHTHGRNCCSAHRRHDPYYHIGSKVQSFENFSHQPLHHSFQLISSQKNFKKIAEDFINEDPIRIFSEHLNWHRLSKIGQISFENFHYRPEPSSVEIYNKKLHWIAESKVSKFSNENINFSPTSQSRISIFSERLKWKPKRLRSFSIDPITSDDNKMKIFPYKNDRLRAMSQIDVTMPPNRQSRILIFHDLPKWNEIVTAKVNSFENFNYRPYVKNYKIYNEKVKWNSESRIKPIIYSENNYIPENSEFSTPNYKLNIIKKYDEDNSNPTIYKIHSIRSDWYPGSKLDTFNVNYKHYQKSLAEKNNFRSEPNLNSIDYPMSQFTNKTPIFSEKLKWNSESKLKQISWGNLHYRKENLIDSQRRKKHNSYEPEFVEPNKKKLTKIKSVSNKINSWNRDYVKYRKQEEAQRQKLVELTKLKAIKRSKYRAEHQQLDPERISNLKSYSRYKELPPIKSANNGDQTDRTNFTYDSFTLRPNWNPNPIYPNNSVNRLLNPDVRDVHLKRYQWDQELKRRSVADHHSSLSRFDAESMNQMNSVNKKDDSHLYGTELLNDLRSRNNSPHRISTGRSGRYSNRIPDTPSTKLGMSISHTPESLTPRSVKKRTKNETDRKSLMMKEHDLKYPKFQPDVEGFEIQGNTLRVDTSTKVRPLANMSFKNAEETAKIRATSRLYSSMMTSRSQYLNTELEHLMD